jgi:hypothetical protein
MAQVPPDPANDDDDERWFGDVSEGVTAWASLLDEVADAVEAVATNDGIRAHNAKMNVEIVVHDLQQQLASRDDEVGARMRNSLGRILAATHQLIRSRL